MEIGREEDLDGDVERRWPYCGGLVQEISDWRRSARGKTRGLGGQLCVTSIGLGTSVDADGFADWYQRVEPALRRALCAAYGPDRGREATAEALAWAWGHRDRLDDLQNPLGYLYRVGQSRTRIRRIRILPSRSEWQEPWIEPRLARGLASLTERQRVAVVLVHCYGWTLREVADLLGVKVTTVQNHVERGLDRLRLVLGVD